MQPIGFEGQICDTSIRTIRGAIEGWVTGTSPIPFGRAVTVTNGVAALTAPGQKVTGISVATDYYGILDGTEKDAYPPKSPINLLTFGDIFVYCEGAIAADTPLLVRTATLAAPKDKLGRFAPVAGTGVEAVAGIKSLKAILAAGIVPVSFNSP